eukprot:2942259-Pleurochrysis_carterae.AAC.1
MTGPADAKGNYGRRMVVQLKHDSRAGPAQAFHLELRWLMCQGQHIEELLKHCTRRAKSVGLLLLQIPTGRKPRPFSPKGLVTLHKSLHERAIAALCCEQARALEGRREERRSKIVVCLKR